MTELNTLKHETSMTSGAPFRAILSFATPLVLGYILQQLYLIIDAVIVGRWIGVGALAAVGASSSIMFLIMLLQWSLCRLRNPCSASLRSRRLSQDALLCEQCYPYSGGVGSGDYAALLCVMR